jgi:glycosyltransferase involved in cell wall biosynthesis
MRVALVVPGGVDRSGEYRVIPALLALIRRLALRNELVVFALHQEPQECSWDLAGVQVHNIGIRHTYLRAVRAICATSRARPVDLVHAIWSGPCGLVAVVAAKILGVASIIHVAGGELVALPEIGYGGRLTWRARLREAVVLRAASAVTAASAPMIESLWNLGLATQRLPLGVGLDTWSPREPERRRSNEPARMIHVASLNRVKDQATLLRALAQVAAAGLSFEMDFVGDDTLAGEVQALAERLGLSQRVKFHGFLTQRQLRPLVEAAQLLVMSSRHEAGPLAVLEAAVAGVPTVGTAVGHIAEWAPTAALAVPVGDWANLAASVGRLLSDEDLRLRLAREALRRATMEDADYTARQFQGLYEKLADAN